MRAFCRARPLLQAADALPLPRLFSPLLSPRAASARHFADAAAAAPAATPATSASLQAHVAAEGAKGAAAAARGLDPTALASTLPPGAVPMPDPALIKGEPLPAKVAALVDAIAGLNLIECMLFSEALRKRLNMPADLMLTTASAAASAAAAPAPAAGGAGGAAAPAAGQAPAPAAAPAAAEKTTVRARSAQGSARSAAEQQLTPTPHPLSARPTLSQVDIKLLSFKAESKIKVIKEVRSITNLGLKEVRFRSSFPRACLAAPHSRAPTPHSSHPPGQGASRGRALHDDAEGQARGRAQDD